jgi:hypothetical protein
MVDVMVVEMAAEARTRVEAGPMIIVATACRMLLDVRCPNRPPCDATGRWTRLEMVTVKYSSQEEGTPSLSKER